MALEYDAATLLSRIQRLQDQVVQLSTVVPFIPLSEAPRSPSQGWVAFSNGIGSIEDFGDAGEGLYRYTGSAWVRIG